MLLQLGADPFAIGAMGKNAIEFCKQVHLVELLLSIRPHHSTQHNSSGRRMLQVRHCHQLGPFLQFAPSHCVHHFCSSSNRQRTFALSPSTRRPPAAPAHARCCWAQTSQISSRRSGMCVRSLFFILLFDFHSVQALLDSAAASPHPDVCFAALQSMCFTVSPCGSLRAATNLNVLNIFRFHVWTCGFCESCLWLISQSRCLATAPLALATGLRHFSVLMLQKMLNLSPELQTRWKPRRCLHSIAQDPQASSTGRRHRRSVSSSFWVILQKSFPGVLSCLRSLSRL